MTLREFKIRRMHVRALRVLNRSSRQTLRAFRDLVNIRDLDGSLYDSRKALCDLQVKAFKEHAAAKRAWTPKD